MMDWVNGEVSKYKKLCMKTRLGQSLTKDDWAMFSKESEVDTTVIKALQPTESDVKIECNPDSDEDDRIVDVFAKSDDEQDSDNDKIVKMTIIKDIHDKESSSKN